MQVIIDRGNTRTKVALFVGPKCKEHRVFELDSDLHAFLNTSVPMDTPIFISNVRDEVLSFLPVQFSKVWAFTEQTRLPFEVRYESIHTLGKDRLANVAGALATHADAESLLVIDSGTCVTYNVVCNRTFIGGAISPGLQMRLEAMHALTGKLPLVSVDASVPTIGLSTDACLQSGAFHGWHCEIDAMIGRLCSELGPLTVLITGGDALLLEEHLESPIFAHPLLTLTGLNEIYLYQSR